MPIDINQLTLESRNGMCFSLPPSSRSARALITYPRHNSDLFIIDASFKRAPVVPVTRNKTNFSKDINLLKEKNLPVVFCRSEPAKSTSVNLDFRTLFMPSAEVDTLVTDKNKTACDLDDVRFIAVAANFLFFNP